MYGKAPTMANSKMPKKMTGKTMMVMVAVSKPKNAPVRGQRTATNMAKKAK